MGYREVGSSANPSSNEREDPPWLTIETYNRNEYLNSKPGRLETEAAEGGEE